MDAARYNDLSRGSANKETSTTNPENKTLKEIFKEALDEREQEKTYADSVQSFVDNAKQGQTTSNTEFDNNTDNGIYSSDVKINLDNDDWTIDINDINWFEPYEPVCPNCGRPYSWTVTWPSFPEVDLKKQIENEIRSRLENMTIEELMQVYMEL